MAIPSRLIFKNPEDLQVVVCLEKYVICANLSEYS